MKLKWLAVGIAAGAPWFAAAEGLTWAGDGSPWPQLRARIGLTLGAASPGDSAARAQGMQLLGDYYFSEQNPQRGSAPSGLRATSGLLFGGTAGGLVLPGRSTGTLSVNRSALSPSMPEAYDSLANATPYFGVGYTTQILRSQWSVSADIGLVSRSLNGNDIRFGRPYIGQSLDDFLHDPQLAPVIQFGVTYSF